MPKTKPPRGRDTMRAVPGTPYLFVRVHPSGMETYLFRYRRRGHAFKKALGHVGILPLDDARIVGAAGVEPARLLFPKQAAFHQALTPIVLCPVAESRRALLVFSQALVTVRASGADDARWARASVCIVQLSENRGGATSVVRG